MDLVPYMYWEKQEAGSQLCAQHCLNNILQQHTYSEFDLAEIAVKLDQAENAALSTPNQNKKSYNFDDTGFFSISVLERALQVWDLTLVRWRGEAMKPFQQHPEDQAAFIMNLSSHWLPLRRFSTSPPTHDSKKRWYNLNSFLPNGPEWISPTYLQMVLAAAEAEGYSVFVVRKAGKEGQAEKEGKGWGDGGVGVLPECEADRIAVALGEPKGRGGQSSTVGGSGSGSSRLQQTSLDQPGVDPSSLPTAGPSSPPRQRKKRQPDLTLSDSDIMDGQTGTFPSTNPDNGEDEHGYDEVDDDEHGDEDVFGTGAGPVDFAYHSRSYDDEDAALQAALKASMEDVPKGWVAPDMTVKKKEKPVSQKQAGRTPDPMPAIERETAVPTLAPAVEHPSAVAAGGSRFKEEIADEEEDLPAEALSPEEIRRRRLARFGGN